MDYFSGIQKIELQSLIKDANKIYAHISVDKRSETIQEHSSLCIKYLKKIIKKKQLENVLMNVEEKFERRWKTIIPGHDVPYHIFT